MLRDRDHEAGKMDDEAEAEVVDGVVVAIARELGDDELTVRKRLATGRRPVVGIGAAPVALASLAPLLLLLMLLLLLLLWVLAVVAVVVVVVVVLSLGWADCEWV